MTTQISVATQMLFPSEGTQTANVKFFRGWSRPASAEKIAEQFVEVERQVRDGEILSCTHIDD